MNAIYLVFVAITLVLSTSGVLGHSSHEALNPAVRDKVSRPSYAAGFQIPRLADFVVRRRSARDPQQAVFQEGVSVNGRKNGQPGGSQIWSKGRFRLPVKAEELGTLATPVAKPWPEKFTVNFTTKSGSASGFVAYDWSQKRQVVYHGPNSVFCAAFGTDDTCQMFESPGGTYVYIPSLEQCSLTIPDVGSLPPDWTIYSEYVGVEDVPGVGLCRSYAFPPTVHVWYETVEGSLPCLFVFPDPDESYYFLPETFEAGTADKKYFDFPDYCFSEGDTVIKELV